MMLGFFCLATALVACKKQEEEQTLEDKDPLAGLNLPSTPFQYTPQKLPDYYRLGPGNQADNQPADNQISDDGATLGRVLFYDKNLSFNNSIACASCHHQEHGFADPSVLSTGFLGGKTGRHSMGLVNARYYDNGRFFWDERASSLEEQVLMPFQDPVEMGMTLPLLVSRLRATEYYPVLFKNAFGDTSISTVKIAAALAQFIRSIISTQSRFDIGRQQVSNVNDAFPNFTAQENQGKALFFGPNTGCAACHGTELFIAPGPRNNGLDLLGGDPGLGGLNGNPQQEGLFKVPSLRNVGLRAPYMHDGRFSNLEEVVEHYNSGVQNHPNLSPPLRLPNNQVRRLNLNNQQKQALVAFLHTLSDVELSTDQKFSSPFK